VNKGSPPAPALTQITNPRPTTGGRTPIDALERNRSGIGFDSLRYDDQIGKISLVGAGMKTNPGVTASFFEALSDAGVNIELISTSEIRISVVTRADDVPEAVRAVHTAFGLDSDSDEAVVYGGTGR
ncbi:ACT domain-containing protein, partial [Streptomyces sp. NPDC059627]